MEGKGAASEGERRINCLVCGFFLGVGVIKAEKKNPICI